MRRAAALPMVLLSLGLVTALSVGGAFVTRRFASDGRLVQRSADLEPAVEQALVEAAAFSDTAALRAMAVGAATLVAMPMSARPVGLTSRAWVTRLTASTFAFVGEVETDSKPLWHKRLGVIVLLDSVGISPLGGRPWSQLP